VRPSIQPMGNGRWTAERRRMAQVIEWKSCPGEQYVQAGRLEMERGGMSSRVGRSYVLSPRARRSTSALLRCVDDHGRPCSIRRSYGGEGGERRRPLGLPASGRKDSPVLCEVGVGSLLFLLGRPWNGAMLSSCCTHGGGLSTRNVCPLCIYSAATLSGRAACW
jgi:hypothetical protein